MEHIIAVKATDMGGRTVAFMTWGRLFDPVDDDELLEVIQKHSVSFEDGPVTGLRLCDSLADATDHKFFYEALLHFAWRPIPFGLGYAAWRQRKRRDLKKSGADLYFLGTLKEAAN